MIVDNAHGAYLKFLSQSQHPIDLGADICCDSAHKTLPVLTGGAYLHLSDEWAEKVLRSYGGTDETIVIIPEGVKKIGANAFNNDHTIEKVVFPESIESIEKHAFVNCDHLKSVEFKGKSRLKLEDLAFDHCTDMREFNLTDNMESYGFDHTISGNIFRGCSKLKVIWEDRKRIIDTAGLMFLCEAFQKTALPSQFKKAEVKREVMAVAA